MRKPARIDTESEANLCNCPPLQLLKPLPLPPTTSTSRVAKRPSLDNLKPIFDTYDKVLKAQQAAPKTPLTRILSSLGVPYATFQGNRFIAELKAVSASDFDHVKDDLPNGLKNPSVRSLNAAAKSFLSTIPDLHVKAKEDKLVL